MFKFKNENTRKEQCVKSIDTTTTSMTLPLNRTRTLFWCFYCRFWTNKCWLDHTLELVIVNLMYCIYHYKPTFIKITQVIVLWIWFTLFEAVVQICSVKKMFLEISQNSQENTCARVSFLIKLQAWTPFFIEHLWWLFLLIAKNQILTDQKKAFHMFTDQV